MPVKPVKNKQGDTIGFTAFPGLPTVHKTRKEAERQSYRFLRAIERVKAGRGTP